VDPTGDTPKEIAILMYDVQSRYDDYAKDKSVPRNGKMDVMFALTKGRIDEAQKIFDDWSARQTDAINLPPTKALLLAEKGDFPAAEAMIPIILGDHPLKDPLYHHAAYDIACVYALEGKSADAVKWLRESAVTGFHLYPRYTRDPLLDRIRHSPEFAQFLADMKAENDRYRREFS
jgi:hypothetical protein